MVKRTYLLVGIILLTSCMGKLRHLTMPKTSYWGDELRIDGYYYSNSYSYFSLDGNDPVYKDVALLYRDGFCIHTLVKVSQATQDTLNYIENEVLLNDILTTKMKNEPYHIGAFRIIYPDITMEIWELRDAIFTHHGKILNDTTFIINKRRSNRTGKIIQENLIYRFVQFGPKPDSTNNFVK